MSIYSREQEKWIADNISDNNRHLNREIAVVKDVGESTLRDFFEVEMSSAGANSPDSEENNSGGLKVEENKAQDTSEVGE